jgi:hypothetical protein
MSWPPCEVAAILASRHELVGCNMVSARLYAEMVGSMTTGIPALLGSAASGRRCACTGAAMNPADNAAAVNDLKNMVTQL